ncbi:MAG: 2-oxoacid:acceptor oxidoreductase family protein [Lentisphaeria bacterium]|nr:2-oxoacid:acceptor oxidoreductase family protein [Lentisphaeria bacterium]
MSEVTSVVFAGLGGQGVLTASDIFADVVFEAGVDVKKSEIHGMSQRGGSVTTEVRFGDCVLSPMVPPGEADFLVVLESSQIENNQWTLKKGGVLLEPGMIDSARLENKKALNVAMLGLLSAKLDFAADVWSRVIAARVPERLREVNAAAFKLGAES